MNRVMKLFITGANGFIGSHLVSHFTGKSGYTVTGMVRKTSRLFRFKGTEVTLKTAALEDRLEDILEGYDAVIHTAARASDWGDYNDFSRTNVTGTANLVQAAGNVGVRRFIHLSSTVVYGFSGNIHTDERHDIKPFSNHYCVTKALAEEVLQDQDRVEVFILRPSNVFGPFDTTTTLPFLSAIDHGLAGFPRGGRSLTSPCYVQNLAHAVELCLTAKQGIGEPFNITDGNDMPWREYLKMMADALGRRPPWIAVPVKPLYGIALVLDALYRAFRSSKPPLITPYRIAQAARDYSFSIDKAIRILGYRPPYTTEYGMQKSVDWYRGYKNSLS
jgi:nucleoside-diphosphate-sugar epimerase